MLKRENPYEFRKRLLTVHEPELRDASVTRAEGEYWIDNNAKIKILSDEGVVIKTAAEDFIDYLKVSMNVSAELVYEGNAQVTIELAERAGVDLGEYKAYKGFFINTSDSGISVIAHDDRGAAQALYYLEDLMTFKKAPAVKFGSIKKKAMFTPQMFHSGYERQVYPDEYLMRMAHEGRDAVIIDVCAEIDYEHPVNDLISRAEKYGIDVYAYSKFKSQDNLHPEDIGAQEFYDGIYGELFKKCPKLKGVILVGESLEFPSKDPHVSPGFRNQTSEDGIPTGKVTSGWYPCEDYAQLLEMIKKSIFSYNPKADIVFWTYNWFRRPEGADLVKKLPGDISLMATFEMCHPRVHGKGKGKALCADYSLAFEGPCEHFLREAKAAKERGIRMYSMTNTGGRTWDFGIIPYQPMPQQWMLRYEAMKKAHDELGLCGIMESHDYGAEPSFITKLSKHAFMEPTDSMRDILSNIVSSEFGRENNDVVIKALNCFSEAIRYYTPTIADQYGAFRVGPSYPFNLIKQSIYPDWPQGFISLTYNEWVSSDESPLSLRIKPEIESLETMYKLMEDGLALLSSVSQPNEKLERLINLGRFITNCVKTGINHKKWYLLCCRMKNAFDGKTYETVLDEMEILISEERKNVVETIPLSEADSSLGYNASMERHMKKYLGEDGNCNLTDRWHLEWKLKQLDYVANVEIPRLRNLLQYHLSNDV